MNFNDAINWFTVNILQNKTLIGTLTGAVVGSWSAYQLNIRKGKQKEELENLNNLNATISLLLNIFNHSLCPFMKNTVKPKLDELKEIEKKKEELKKHLQNISHPQEETRAEIAKKIGEDKPIKHEEVVASIKRGIYFDFDIDINKLIFINTKEPSLLILLVQIQEEIKTLTDLITEYNYFVQEMRKKSFKRSEKEDLSGKESPTEPINKKQDHYLTTNINAIAQTINNCIFFINKALILLNDFGEAYFPKKPLVRRPEMKKEDENLIPKDEAYPECTFNKIEKKIFWNEYTPTFNGWFNWLFSIIKKIKNRFKNKLKANIIK